MNNNQQSNTRKYRPVLTEDNIIQLLELVNTAPAPLTVRLQSCRAVLAPFLAKIQNYAVTSCYAVSRSTEEVAVDAEAIQEESRYLTGNMTEGEERRYEEKLLTEAMKKAGI